MADYAAVVKETNAIMTKAGYNPQDVVLHTQDAVIAVLLAILEETITVRKELEHLREERKNA